MKKILIPVLAFAICFTVLWKWTYGFTSFTIFSYTLSNAGPLPRSLPEIQFVNQDDQVFKIQDKHKYVLINFVYLNCPNVCHKVNNQLEKIYHSLDSTIVPSQLEFVTVSFDMKNDHTDKIKKYRSYFGTDIAGWTFALPYQTTESNFRSFLKKTGIWAQEIPETGIINHSTYIFLISPNSKIVQTFDPARESNQSIINQIQKWVKQK